MDMKLDLDGAIERCTKSAIRALKRNDEDSAFNSLKALVHMYIRMYNFQKAEVIIRMAREVFNDF